MSSRAVPAKRANLPFNQFPRRWPIVLGAFRKILAQWQCERQGRLGTHQSRPRTAVDIADPDTDDPGRAESHRPGVTKTEGSACFIAQAWPPILRWQYIRTKKMFVRRKRFENSRGRAFAEDPPRSPRGLALPGENQRGTPDAQGWKNGIGARQLQQADLAAAKTKCQPVITRPAEKPIKSRLAKDIEITPGPNTMLKTYRGNIQGLASAWDARTGPW